MGFSNFLTTYGHPPRQTPQLQNWLVNLLGFLEEVPGIVYNSVAGGPTIPTSLDALYPGGADNGIVVWNNTSLSTITLYFNFDGTWVVGPSTATGGGGGDTIPPGVTIPYSGTAAAASALSPDWLICYGQAVSRVTFADLWTVLGITHGAGDGTTTFNLPDLRGRVVGGNDNMGGVSADNIVDANADTVGGSTGSETHTLASGEIPSHRHSLLGKNNSPDGTDPQGRALATANIYRTVAGAVDRTMDSGSIGLTGGGGAHANVQPTFFLHYLIKT